MTYSQFEWLPLCGGLTLLGLIISWVVWRRRGAAAGLRWAAISLLPMAAYLTKATRMLWQIGSAIGSFASGFIFSPQVWSGVALTGLGSCCSWCPACCGAAARPAAEPRVRAGQRARGRPGREGPQAARARAPAADDDLGDVADILRRHNIH